MEKKLTNWVSYFKSKNLCFPNSRLIKKKAKEFSRYKNIFKASKGWLEKFLTRNFPEDFPAKAYNYKDSNKLKQERRSISEEIVLSNGEELIELGDSSVEQGVGLERESQKINREANSRSFVMLDYLDKSIRRLKEKFIN